MRKRQSIAAHSALQFESSQRLTPAGFVFDSWWPGLILGAARFKSRLARIMLLHHTDRPELRSLSLGLAKIAAGELDRVPSPESFACRSV